MYDHGAPGSHAGGRDASPRGSSVAGKPRAERDGNSVPQTSIRLHTRIPARSRFRWLQVPLARRASDGPRDGRRPGWSAWPGRWPGGRIW
jgi:hypothetical protein